MKSSNYRCFFYDRLQSNDGRTTRATTGTIEALFLSCHDGMIAVDSFGGSDGSTNISGTKGLGIDLSDDHPVSVEWKHQSIETSSEFCLNCHFGAPREVVFFRPGGSGPICVECATCHDVHNKTGHQKLLRKTLVESKLCLTCHEK